MRRVRDTPEPASDSEHRKPLSGVDLHGISQLGHVQATRLNPNILVLSGEDLLPEDCLSLKPVAHFPWSMIHQVAE
ncbi:hypothetical protein MPER_11772, partial [Moniliophthora perniciosa FA553]